MPCRVRVRVKIKRKYAVRRKRATRKLVQFKKAEKQIIKNKYNFVASNCVAKFVFIFSDIVNLGGSNNKNNNNCCKIKI